MTRYITYTGLGTHYLVILTKPKTTLTPTPEVLATLSIGKNDIVAVDDYTFDLLQSHFGDKKLREVPQTELKAH